MSTVRRRWLVGMVMAGYPAGLERWGAAFLVWSVFAPIVAAGLALLALGWWLRPLAEDWNGARCGGVHLPQSRLVLREDAPEDEAAAAVLEARG